MFFEMFAASSLATILFSCKSENNSEYPSKLSLTENSIKTQLKDMEKTQNFMKARLSLMEFSPKLLGEPTLTFDKHKIEDIMEASKVFFESLLEEALADDNNFIKAREIFYNTYGNSEWIEEKYGQRIRDIESFIEKYTDKIPLLEKLICLRDEYRSLSEELFNISKLKFIRKKAISERLEEIRKEVNYDTSIFSDPLISFHEQKKLEDGDFYKSLYEEYGLKVEIAIRKPSDATMITAIELSKLL